MKPPKATKIPKTLSIHNDTRIDNYYWLNDRKDAKVIEYLNAENAYREALMKHTEDFQSSLFKEIVGRIKQTDMSVPYKKDGYIIFLDMKKEKNIRFILEKRRL